MPVSKCEELKNPNDNDAVKNKKTILTLANDQNLDGKFFFTKQQNNEHWAWWVFPSFAFNNPTYNNLFNFSDDAEIYKNIANNQQYLEAYTQVMKYITNEIQQASTNFGNVDWSKAFTCFYRIHNVILNMLFSNHLQQQFEEQFKLLCNAVAQNQHRIINDWEACKFFKAKDKNQTLLSLLTSFAGPVIPKSSHTTTNPKVDSVVVEDKSKSKELKSVDKEAVSDATPSAGKPIVHKPIIKNKPSVPYKQPVVNKNIKSQPVIPQHRNNFYQMPFYQMPFFQNTPFVSVPMVVKNRPRVFYNGLGGECYMKSGDYKSRVNMFQHKKRKTSTIKWYDVLLCVVLPVIWWFVLASKINNKKAKTSLNTKDRIIVGD